MSMDIKTIIYGLEAGKILFLEKAYKVSIVYFTGLPVVLSLYPLYSSRAGLQIQSKPPVTCWCNGLSLTGK